ncbi:unnamed protein product [Boreogadus saida]
MELDANNTPNTRVDVDEAGFNVLKEAMAAGRPGQSACVWRLAWHRISKNKPKVTTPDKVLEDHVARRTEPSVGLSERSVDEPRIPDSASITTTPQHCGAEEEATRIPPKRDEKFAANERPRLRKECPWSVRPALGTASAVPHPLRWAAGGTLGEERTGGDRSCTALLRLRHTTRRSQAVTTPPTSGCGVAFSSAL